MSGGQPQGGNDSEELTLEQIAGKYKSRWVAILVTARDRNSQPTKGKVVGHDVDRFRLRSGLMKYPDICIFYTGEPPYPMLL